MQTELVVLSHLRWTFVWQRPQHIVSRLARTRRTWFVEEPVGAPVGSPRLRSEDHGRVTRVWLEVPAGGEGHVGFGDPRAAGYGAALGRLLGACGLPIDNLLATQAPSDRASASEPGGDGGGGRSRAAGAQPPRQLGPAVDRVAWLYTAMALPLADAVRPSVLAYDVMDDLASFDGAPQELALRHRQALRAADIVFTGGRTIHQGVRRHRPDGAHLFPSGVEPEHFLRARALRAGAPPRPRPVAGYVGVIDERIDRSLLAELARELHDWEVRVVGPVTKIEPTSLPSAPNLSYPGPVGYERLPDVLAGFDVALMPFALNRATRAISPTKTLEYLAAGLPVVSTPVPDVVADHSDWVDVVPDGKGFAAACRRALAEPASARQAAVDEALSTRHWDAIASRMEGLLAAASAEAMRRQVTA